MILHKASPCVSSSMVKVSLFLVIVAASLDMVAAECFLCEKGILGLTHPGHFIDEYGTRCAQHATIIFSITDKDICQQHIDNYREPCCGTEEPEEIEQEPATLPPSDFEQGDWPDCDLCRNKQFPGNPSMVINMLYLGPMSCRQYWDAGKTGNIPKHLCSPLQFFSKGPCECGDDGTDPPSSSEDNSKFTTSPTQYPSASPTQGKDKKKNKKKNKDKSKRLR